MLSAKRGKRKLNSSLETKSVAEQVESVREYLAKKIKKKNLTDLRKKLAFLNKELKNNFTHEQINYFRDLKEQHVQTLKEIDDITTDKKLIEFENYVKSLNIENFQTTNSEDQLIFKCTPVAHMESIESIEYIESMDSISKLDGVDKFKLGNDNYLSFEEVDYVPINQEHQLDNNSELCDSISVLKYSSSTSTAPSLPNVHVHINTHTFTPLMDIDAIINQQQQNKASKNVKCKLQKFTLKADLPVREYNSLHEKIIDYNLIAPKHAERDICPNCVKPLIHSEEEAILSCIECGLFRTHIDTSNNTAQSHYFTSRTANGTQKYNIQFDIILGYFDIENWIEIPDSVYEIIRSEVKMTENTTYISSLRIRDILRHYKLKQYYRNIVQIYSHLNGIIPPVMTKEKKTSFQHAFKMLKAPFEKHKAGRTNFLSYALTFKKLCKHLGYEEYIPFLDIVKSTKSLQLQEKIWENMCVFELGWDYERDM